MDKTIKNILGVALIVILVLVVIGLGCMWLMHAGMMGSMMR